MIISKDENIQGVVRIVAKKNGPRVVMFAGVHGDEVSGVHAIEKLFFDFFGGKSELLISQLFRLLSLEFFCDSFHDAA